MASSKRNHNVEDGIMNGGSPKQIEIVVLIWLIGLIVGEMQQVFIFKKKSLIASSTLLPKT